MTRPERAAPLIELDRVAKVYRTRDVDTRALDDVSLAIGAGEYVALTGPSGCGKSTLLAVLGLLEPWTSGRLLLNGIDMADVDEAERARVRGLYIGMVFQAFQLLPALSVLDNVAFPLQFHRALPRRDREVRAREALARVGLSARADHYPAQLSGGQQQRVAFARAIVGEPKILLADEPTGNLDSANGDAVMELIRDAHRAGVTVCLVTHDQRYLKDATRHIVMSDGRVEHPEPVRSDTRSAEHLRP